MEKLTGRYKITVIFKDEIKIEKFNNKHIAIDTVIAIKNLFPELFVGGGVEERKKKWTVIWTLGCD